MPTIEQIIRDSYSSWNDGETLARLGQVLQSRNRFDDARRILTRAVELRPDDVDSWAELAFVNYRDSRNEDATDVMRRGIEATNSDYLKAVHASFSDEAEASQIWKELEGTEDLDVQAVRLCHRFWKEENRRPLLNELIALQEKNPDNRIVRDYLLWTLIGGKHRGFLDDLDIRTLAVPLAERKIAAEDGRMAGCWLLMQVYIAEKDWDSVLEVTSRFLDQMPDEETIMQGRARAYREKGEYDRAVYWLSRAIGAKPTFAGARADLGKTYEKLGKLDLAEEILTEIPKANPGYTLGEMPLALFLARQVRFEEAEAIFKGTWPNVPPYYRAAVLKDPDASALLERDAIKEIIKE